MSKRLDGLLSGAGFSRSEAQKLIKTKRIAVNGQIVNDPAFHVGENDSVTLDGKVLDTSPFVYLILNKPAGYESTTDDIPESVLKLVPPEWKRRDLAPAGRLDKDSEGLLLLTNDGAFAHSVISPKHDIEKLYYIELVKPLTEEAVRRIADGMTLGDGTVCQPARIEPCPVREDGTGAYAALITLREGKYHQVKRMLGCLENHVTRLVRLRVGDYTLEELKPGEMRRFTPHEKA